MIMGTVGYMSPEQVRGVPAGPASDIFSLGCVLYEMVSSKRAFQGQTAAETLSSILRDPPPDLTSTRYAKSYNEVKLVGDVNSTARTPHLSDVARFYSQASATIAWNSVANQLAAEEGTSLPENARTLALINMAISDAFVTVMETKYHYTRWRPETAIRAGDADGNRKTEADPDFLPFILTPCFPSYPSNHGSGTNAAAEVMRRLYGEAGHSITVSNPALPTIVLQYTSFRQIADDVSDARVYGGIHFRTDQDAGARLGRAVAAAVYKGNLRPTHDDD